MKNEKLALLVKDAGHYGKFNYVLAYQIQIRAYGGLNKAIKRELLGKATPSQRRPDAGCHKAVSQVKLSPGPG